MTTLRLSDGTVIDTSSGEVVDGPGATQSKPKSDFVAIPTHYEAQQEMTRVRRRIADLPDVPEKMNAVSVVAMYHMWGLEPYDIALATSLSENQVDRIMQLEAFDEMVSTVKQNILENQGEDVRAMLAGASKSAADRMLRLLNSEDEKVQTTAARDILDRAGHRPADVVEHRHKMEGGLTIEYKRRETSDDEPPLLDITPIEGGDNGSGS